MTANLNTFISLKGTQDELLAMLRAVRKFETEKLEQYRTEQNCGYIEFVKVKSQEKTYALKDASENDLANLADCGSLDVNAIGPYGSFGEPGEVGLFEALAEAAPQAYFKGSISGFVTGADVAHDGILDSGILHLSDYYAENDALTEAFVKYVKKKLTYSKFCKIFKVDKDEFDADEYEDFLTEALEDGFPGEMDYDTFADLCGCSELDEDQFDSAMEKAAALDILDYDAFCASAEDDFSKKRTYDPKAKKYGKEIKKKESAPVFCDEKEADPKPSPVAVDIPFDQMTMFAIGQIKGKKDEVISFLRILKEYEEGAHDYTVTNVSLHPKDMYALHGNTELKGLSEDGIAAYAESLEGRKKSTFFSFSIMIGGKGSVKKAELPQDLFHAAPHAAFFVSADGTNEIGYQVLDIKLKGDVMSLKYRISPNAETVRDDWDIIEEYKVN